MEKNVIDLIMFLDICQLYFQTKKKSRDLCTLWAIITFIRTEDSRDFLQWCQKHSVLHLRHREENKRANSFEKIRGQEKKILRILQELFYCGCLPQNNLGI